MKKVLYIHHGGSFGGAIFSLLAMVKSLDKSRFSVKVLFLVPDKKSLELFRSEGIESEFVDEPFYLNKRNYFIHSEVGNNKWYSLFSMYKTLIYWRKSANIFAQRVLEKENPDILHLNSSVLSDWSFAAKKLNIKNIIHIREPLANGYFGIRRSIFRNIVSKSSDHIIAISKDNARRVDLLDKTTVIYNQISIDNNTKESLYNTKTVLFAGGNDTHKGFISFAKSIPFIDKSISILILGNIDTVERRFWQPSYYVNRKKSNLLNKIKSKSNVQIIGAKSNIIDFIAKSTVTLSYFNRSHFSRLILESYAMNKTAIGSDVIGMDEIIEDGITGYIVPKNNYRKLAAVINTVCLDTSLAEKMGKEGNLLYKSKFQLKNKFDYENIYDNLLIN